MTQQQQEADTADPGWKEPLSRPIDVHRWSDYPELNQCLSDLVIQIEDTEGRTRRRKAESAKRFRDAVRSIVLDLYVAWLADPVAVVGVALGKDKFRSDSRYRALFLTYDTFIPAYEGLARLGYLQIVQRGYNYGTGGQARTTRVRATGKLIELLTGPAKLTVARLSYRSRDSVAETIVLRDKTKRSVDYTDTNYTITIRDEVERINALLSKHWIDLRVSDAEMVELNERMATDYKDGNRARSSVDFAAKRLRRIFNEHWEQGGRFYGGWWQNIPKEYRSYITIDDKRTVEVDYSEMHPLMMYASVDATMEDKDAYEVGLPHVPRSVVKLAFNKLVNAEGRMNPEKDLALYGVSSDELRERIRERHRPIAQFFRSGHGSRLQKLDADLAARVMIRFLQMGYVCLPVHDSFIVHHELEDDLRQIMVTDFKEMFGVDPGTKTKHGTARHPASGLVDISIGELLSPEGDRAGYETRLNDWWSTKGQP